MVVTGYIYLLHSKKEPTYNQKLNIHWIFIPFIKIEIIWFIAMFSKESNSRMVSLANFTPYFSTLLHKFFE